MHEMSFTNPEWVIFFSSLSLINIDIRMCLCVWTHQQLLLAIPWIINLQFNFKRDNAVSMVLEVMHVKY